MRQNGTKPPKHTQQTTCWNCCWPSKASYRCSHPNTNTSLKQKGTFYFKCMNFQTLTNLSRLEETHQRWIENNRNILHKINDSYRWRARQWITIYKCMQYAICNMQHATCNKQNAISKMQNAKGKRQKAKCNMQYTIYNGHTRVTFSTYLVNLVLL